MTTTEDVTAALEKAIAAKGEGYVYEPIGATCRYTTEEKSPSCIVGWVVAEVNPPLFDALFDFEQTGNVIAAHDLDRPSKEPDFLDDELALEVDRRTLDALQAAQEIQDEGLSWAYAKRAYDNVLAGQDYREAIDEITATAHSEQEKEEQQ